MEDRQAYTLTEAARVLATSEGALRQRIRRGTIENFKGDDGRVYVYVPHTYDVHTHESHALTSEMQARVEILEQELERAHEREREMRRLLAAALERIPPQLEAPPEPRESPESTAEPVQSTQAPPQTQTPSERPWWRRVFGR